MSIVYIPFPDWSIFLVLLLISICGFITIMSGILDMSLWIKINKTGTYKTKRWVYTRTKREDV